MIGLDTNVLVRYFTQDDAEQAARANELIDNLTESSPGYVTRIVLAELHWILSRAYKTERTSVLALIRGLLHAKEIVVEAADTVGVALQHAEEGADLADALIREAGAQAGCTATVTFDQGAAKSAGMRLLG